MFIGISYQCSNDEETKANYKQLKWCDDNYFPESICIQKTNIEQDLIKFIVITDEKSILLCSITKVFDSDKEEDNIIEHEELCARATDAIFVEDYIIVLINNNVTIRSVNNPKSVLYFHHFDQKVLKLKSSDKNIFVIFQNFKAQTFRFDKNIPETVKSQIISFTDLTKHATQEPFVVVKTREDMKTDEELVGDFKYTVKGVFYTDFNRKNIFMTKIGSAEKRLVYDNYTTIMDFDVRDANKQEIIVIESSARFDIQESNYLNCSITGQLVEKNIMLDQIIISGLPSINIVIDKLIPEFISQMKKKSSTQLEYVIDNSLFVQLRDAIDSSPSDKLLLFLDLVITRQKNAVYTYGIRASKRAEFLDEYGVEPLRPPVISLLQCIWEKIYDCKKRFVGEEMNEFCLKMIEMIPYIQFCSRPEIIELFIRRGLYSSSHELTSIVVNEFGRVESLNNFENLRSLWKIYKWINTKGKMEEMYNKYREIANKIARITNYCIGKDDRDIRDLVVSYYNEEIERDVIMKIPEIQFMEPDNFMKSIENLLLERIPLKLNDGYKSELKRCFIEFSASSRELFRNQAKVSILEASFFKHKVFEGLEKIATKN